MKCCGGVERAPPAALFAFRFKCSLSAASLPASRFLLEKLGFWLIFTRFQMIALDLMTYGSIALLLLAGVRPLCPKVPRSPLTYRARAGAPRIIANARRWGAGRVLALASAPWAWSIIVLYFPAAKPPHPPAPAGGGGAGGRGAADNRPQAAQGGGRPAGRRGAGPRRRTRPGGARQPPGRAKEARPAGPRRPGPRPNPTKREFCSRPQRPRPGGPRPGAGLGVAQLNKIKGSVLLGWVS